MFPTPFPMVKNYFLGDSKKKTVKIDLVADI